MLCTLVLHAVAGEPPLRDPTRPPLAPQPSAAAAPASAPPSAGALTAIRIGEDQRTATIGGRRVKVGDRVGDGAVRVIRATEVVLATPSGVRVLKLYPGVRQQASGGHRGASASVAGHTGSSASSGTAVARGAGMIPTRGESSQ